MSSADLAGGLPTIGAKRILCTGIIVLDEVFRVEEFPQAGRQGAGERIFRRQRRLRRQCRGGDRAAWRPRRARRADGRSRRRGRQRRPGAQGAGARKCRLQRLSARRRSGDRAVGDFHECARRPHHRDLSRRTDRGDAAAPIRTAIVAAADAVLADNRYPAFVRADLRSGAAPRCSRLARRRPPDGRGRSAVPPGLACHFFLGMFARDDRRRRSRRGAGAASRARPTPFLPSATGRTTSSISTAARSAGCRCSRLPPWIRSAPAMPFTAASCWRWRKGEARSRPCASAPRSPGSSARGSAARPAPRPGRKSRPFWRTRRERGRRLI